MKITTIINRYLKSWGKGHSKLVVAIDGYTGVGKTTVLTALAKVNKNILAVHRDDFLYSHSRIARLFNTTKNKPQVFELYACNQKKLTKLINAFQSDLRSYRVKTYNHKTGKVDVVKTYDLTKKFLVVEGVFMFHPKLSTSKLWDKRIYLKGNIKKIDQRRIAREKEKWGNTYIPETRPDSYFHNVKLALNKYSQVYKPEKYADLMINVDTLKRNQQI